MKFEAKVRYAKIDLNSGKEKVVSQDYILEAETFGEAEELTLKSMSEITNGTVTKAIKISDVSEIIESEGDNFYKVKFMIADVDPLSGKEKATPHTILIRANTVRYALKLAEDWADQSVCDIEIQAVRLVTIIDQLPFTKVQVVLPNESSSADAYDPAYDADLDDEDEEEELELEEETI